jgi:hypothetical protein
VCIELLGLFRKRLRLPLNFFVHFLDFGHLFAQLFLNFRLLFL